MFRPPGIGSGIWTLIAHFRFSQKFVGKVERGPRKKPLDFGGNPDRVTFTAILHMGGYVLSGVSLINVSSTRQHESSRIRASSTGDSLISGEVSYTLAGRCRPGSVQSLRPGVQMSALDGF